MISAVIMDFNPQILQSIYSTGHSDIQYIFVFYCNRPMWSNNLCLVNSLGYLSSTALYVKIYYKLIEYFRLPYGN